MKVIHIESGLGNQMLSYCEYIALKKENPDDDFYLETIIYDIPECNDTICQWNGYELERIFGIREPKNVRTLFGEGEWQDIMQEIRDTQFWHRNWNYPVHFTHVFNRHGLDLENIRGDFEDGKHGANTDEGRKTTLRRRMIDSRWGLELKRRWYQLARRYYIGRNDRRALLYMQTDKSIFTGQWLAFKLVGNERWRIEEDIRRTFVFPPFADEKNREMARLLESCASVAIHARRGDMLSVNGWCYKYGYFQRAVRLIRRMVDHPVFVFFTNTGSIDWCKENADIFGLDFSRDEVYFVNWNTGTESYRDMQLMGHCRHAIITNSSFGWWGAYFIQHPDKITISPSIEIDTTHHC